MKLSPIIVFAYNRPIYLRQTLEALEKNAEFKDSKLYFFCDGPKLNATSSDLENIHEVRALVREKKWCKDVTILESNSNKGLAESIINGVTMVLEEHNSVIVLEDDLVTSPYFLNFMNIALNKYEQNDEVIAINGYNYPIKYEDNFPDTFFLKNADCFGWGTWKKKWDLFERDASVLVKKIEAEGQSKEFDFDGQYPYMKMLKGVANGKINSWAIRWYASCFVNNKISLFPKKSLVRNIGSIGTNFKADNKDILGWDIYPHPIAYYENKLVEDTESRKKCSKHFRKYNRRRLSLSSVKYFYKRFIYPNLAR
ncbi:MAG: glycosyltransferase family A protein [Bacteroidota bacterium]